ncbi:MAG: N-acetyltransferase [Anaerolineae bacterium]|jgi:ribosomal protein S18 acetylase RimI-like enzyme
MHSPLSVHIRPATPTDAPALGRLWWLAFPDKFGPALGDNPQRNAHLLADVHRVGQGRILHATLVAETNEQAIGFLLLHPGREGFGDFPLREGWQILQHHLGTFRALRAALVLAMLEIGHPSPPRDHTIVEMVGVDPRWRGRGVGRALMKEAIAQARARGARAVSLEVVWGNDPARRLYESLGFAVVFKRRSQLAGWLFDHQGWTRMTLPLKEESRMYTGTPR